MAGLGVYERWIRARTAEDGYALRVVARALLEEAALDKVPGVRIEGLRDLAADGDAQASARLKKAAYAGGAAETRALAGVGDPGRDQHPHRAAERARRTDGHD